MITEYDQFTSENDRVIYIQRACGAHLSSLTVQSKTNLNVQPINIIF